MNKQDQILRAALLGTDAFKAGKGSAPCLNKEVMEMLTGRPVGETPKGEASSIEIMDAYSNSWHAANLAA